MKDKEITVYVQYIEDLDGVPNSTSDICNYPKNGFTEAKLTIQVPNIKEFSEEEIKRFLYLHFQGSKDTSDYVDRVTKELFKD